MVKISSDILGIADEAAVLAEGGRIVYANSTALHILGEDCVDKSLRTVFDVNISEAQASCFAADTCIKGRHYIARVKKSGGQEIIFFSEPRENAEILSDAFIYSLRSSLMTLSLSVDMCRARAEELGCGGMEENISAITKNQFTLSRLLANLSLARGVLRNELPFSPRTMDISGFCAEFIECVKMICPNVEFSLSAAPGIIICADGGLLEQLLLNIVSNSIVHGRSSHIDLSLLESPGSVILSASDDGCGISDEELHSVFESYRHIDDFSSMSRGAGLGLTVVRGIAEKHGGTLLLESRQGSGTTVRVSLRKRTAALCVRSGQEAYAAGFKGILTGLSGCADDRFYSTEYMD
jgi:anti-sigma regulatory factor (Ser/Thr protein kinase)